MQMSPPMPSVAPRFGEYDIVAPLAHGGMGGVYLARHITSGEQVALKVLDPLFANHPEVVARLYSERSIATKATHPGLVSIRAAGKSTDDVPYLVMEYLEGKTLATMVGQDLDVGEIIGLGAQLAAALAALHEAGIIHCDIKPENV